MLDQLIKERSFSSGYVPVECNLTLKDIQDRHDLFIADTNSLCGILNSLEVIERYFFNGEYGFADELITISYGQLKVLFNLVKNNKLRTLTSILETEYQTDRLLKQKMRENPFFSIEIDEKDAIKISKTIGYQLSLREELQKNPIFLKDCGHLRIKELFLNSSSCVRENKEKNKEISDIDLEVYFSGLHYTEQGENCAILSWDSDLLLQKPLERRTIISNKRRRKLISKGVREIPRFYRSPTIYFPQERLPSGLPDLFMRYQNPDSHRTLILH